MKDLPPCERDCKERQLKCHARCEKYNSWKDRVEKQNQEIRKERNKMIDLEMVARKRKVMGRNKEKR